MLGLHSIVDMPLNEWYDVCNVNVASAMMLSQKVAPIMKAKGKGVIINTSSVAGYAAKNGATPYVVSKFAMEGLTKSMANELGPEIRVNTIAPGLIHTAMVDSVGGLDALTGMIQGCALKRHGVPEDIASVALFFASDDSSFITGQSLLVDGGWDL
jgi:3-oxoacyl-[acyl-carrier protein] reductase